MTWSDLFVIGVCTSIPIGIFIVVIQEMNERKKNIEWYKRYKKNREQFEKENGDFAEKVLKKIYRDYK